MQKHMVFEADSIVSDSLQGPLLVSSLIDVDRVVIAPEEIISGSGYDYITYVVLILIGIAALIWHFMPDRFRVMFSLRTDKHSPRSGYEVSVVPGNLITGFMTLNFFLTSGIFITFLIQYFFADFASEVPLIDILGFSYLVLFVLIAYRTILIYSLSLLFNTAQMRNQQMKISRNILFMTGIFLLPVIPLIIYTNIKFILIFAVAIIAILQIIRIVRNVAIGKSSSMFSTLHIILYLCALEIVPILVLVRMIGNSSGMY